MKIEAYEKIFAIIFSKEQECRIYKNYYPNT